jgi:short-subunit dehydrogenase involved in D-alanine esterification of teichoic acids
MGLIRSSILLVAGTAVGVGLMLAHRVSQETGKGLTESFAEVPAEAQKLYTDVRARVDEAIARGRDAYTQKQAEMDEHMRGAE